MRPGYPAAVEPVDRRQRSAAFGRESRPERCESLISQDASRNGLSLDEVHDEAFSKSVVRLEHMPDVRHGNAALLREPDDIRLRRQIDPVLSGRREAIRAPAAGPGARHRSRPLASKIQVSWTAPPERGRSPSIAWIAGITPSKARRSRSSMLRPLRRWHVHGTSPTQVFRRPALRTSCGAAP